MRNRINSKLFLAYLIVSLFFGAALILTFYLFNVDNTRSNAQANLVQLNQNMLNQIDNQIKVLDSASIEIVSNYEFITHLQNINSSDESISSQDTSGIKKLILNSFVNKYDIYRISVITEAGQFISTGDTNLKPLEIANFVQSNNWLENELALSGRKFILPPHVDSWFSESGQQVISVVRAVNVGGEIIGFVEIQQIQQVVSSIFDQEFNGYKIRGILIDSEGNVIYDSNPTATDSQQILEKLRVLMKDYVSQTIQYNHKFLNIGSSNYVDWQLALVLPENIIYQTLNQLILMIALFSLLIIFLSVTFFTIVTRRITKPIMRLVGQISDVNINTLQQEFPVDSHSFEASVLAKAFQEMTHHLGESIIHQNRMRDIQTKATFDALQSQIGPHFLYNSLGSIANMCENEQSESAANACYSLTDILRYSANYQQPIVSLKAEAEMLDAYLYLMKTRYQHRINYSLSIDDLSASLELPRLTLQPLVENAIKYSLAEIETVEVNIQAQSTGMGVTLTVSDNGAGFTDERISQVKTRFNEMINDAQQSETQKITFGNMGLLGTLIRLSLYFGPAFHYDMQNSKTGGAKISLFLPSPDNAADSMMEKKE